MAHSTRVLFVTSALTPFTELSPLASLTRSLPEALQEAGDFETRIMMPCYGNIDERKHNLHEVIRLSGTDVPMGAETESVTVKVASVPDARLQVYFMDHDGYFERNGRATDADGEEFEDNARRALFFNRSVLETIRKLRWGPDVIHSFGWISSLSPPLLATTYSDDDLLGSAQSIFTPDDLALETRIPSSFTENMELSLDGSLGSTLSEMGLNFADANIFPPNGSPTDGASQFSDDAGHRSEQLATLYNQMLGEVPA